MAPLRIMQMRMAAPIATQRSAPERIDPARRRPTSLTGRRLNEGYSSRRNATPL
jgi:hypothetical protein